MSNELVIGRAEKTAGDAIRMYLDFGNLPLLIAGARIAEYTVTASGSGAPTITDERLDYYYQVSAWVSAGTPREAPYSVVFRIVLDDEDATVISRSLGLKIW